MRINYIIEVPDPQNISNDQKKISSDLQEHINARVAESTFCKSYKGEIYIYIFIKENRPVDEVRKLKPGLFLGIDNAITNLSEDANVFFNVLSMSIRSRLEIPDTEQNCIIYISQNPIDTNSFFAMPKETLEKQMIFEAVDPIYSLDEVVMSPKERCAVMRAITLIRDKKLIYEKWKFKNVDKTEKSILCFHGVPGTGKSMCAHAVASCLGKKIILGSYAQIESEFVGVGAKNLVALFNAAQEQDAVLFIDEADTFLSRRLPASNDSSKHYNSMSNELYQLIENFNGCIVFASNHIKDFDPAVISRIIEPIEFNLPDFDGRKAILDNMLQNEFPLKEGKNEETLLQLSNATEGFSGRDLRKMLQIAHAYVVWKYKYEQGIPEDEIVASLDDLMWCIKEVKDAKNKIQSRVNPTKNLLTSFVDTERKNTKVLQLAAHALLADGVVDQNEKNLFKQLETSLKVSCPLEKNSLPNIKTICMGVEDNSEKAEFLDVVCRMSAIDGEIHDSELALLREVCDCLDVDAELFDFCVSYSQKLASNYSTWRKKMSLLGVSDSEILSKLKEEYSEGAAYYRLSQYYQNGSSLFGGIKINEVKAEKYKNIARELGYKKMS